MIEEWELDRMRAILRKEATGWASPEERQELRTLINNHTGKALGLPWPALVEVAQFWVRLHPEDEFSTQAA